MSDSERALKIRPHHGLCMQFFEGKGYSEAFVQGMSGILARLAAGCPLELSEGADSICAACPHHRDGVCDDEQRVGQFDRQVLTLCGLHGGERMSRTALDAAVWEGILSCGRLCEVCGDCEWASLCTGRLRAMQDEHALKSE